jgi:hyaluronan synthase
MYTLLASSPNLAGVTADVKIWNRNDSFLALMCAIRYWFAFNVERACQSFWGCVSCISGPMGLYRTYDLDRILGPWSLQSFAGRMTTFGDDRHLTNQLLGLGLNTRYTHRTFCQSESPTQFVRWVKQQTRWSKSFFREAFWFPTSFAYHSFWLTVETTKQSLYPFVLIATVLHFLYCPTMFSKPIAWLATMFGVAFIKSLFALTIERDPRMLLFSFYGVFYFFGLLPSVRIAGLFAILLSHRVVLLLIENLCHSYDRSDRMGHICSRHW